MKIIELIPNDQGSIDMKFDSVLSNLQNNWYKSDKEAKQEILRLSCYQGILEYQLMKIDEDSLADWAYDNSEKELIEFTIEELVRIMSVWDGKVMKKEKIEN